MKIGIDASWACGDSTGTGRFTKDLIQGLTSLHSSHVFYLYFRSCCERSNPLFGIIGENVIKRVVDARSTIYRILVPLSSQLRKDAVDTFVSPAYFLPLFGSRKWVVTFFDFNVYRLAHEWARPATLKGLILMRTLFPLSIFRADKIVTISNSTQVDLARYFPSALGKSTMVYPGLHIEDISESQSLSERCGRPGSHGPFVLYVGTLSPMKNLERMLKAFAAFKEQDTRGFDFVLVGRDQARFGDEVLRPLAKRLGIEKSVTFTGYVSGSDLARLYSTANCLFYPSLWEGFGYPILEAQYFKLPVITSNISSCPEVGGEAAVYVDPRSERDLCNALCEITGNEALRARLISTGKDRWKLFSLDAMATSYLRLIDATGPA